MKHLTSLKTVALVVLAVFAFAACGSDETSTSGETSAASIDGREFWSTSVTQGGEEVQLVEGTRIQLSFRGDEIGASAGCNSMGGTYEIDDGVLLVGSMFMTEMGCEPPRHDQDMFVADFLTASPTFELSGDTLTLSTSDVVMELLDRDVADPDEPIVGTRWTTTGFIQGDVAMSMAITGDDAWLEFPDESTMTGFDSCIHIDAPVEVGDGEIQFGEITSPDAAVTTCLASDYLVAFNELFATGDATFTITGPNLTMLNGVGNGVTFSAE